MSTDHEFRAIAVDEESLTSWEPGGLEYVVRLTGTLDDRWVESFVLTRRRSARFSRFHLNRARGRVSFLCRDSDDPAGLVAVVENLKLLVAQTNRRASIPGPVSEPYDGDATLPMDGSEDETIELKLPLPLTDSIAVSREPDETTVPAPEPGGPAPSHEPSSGSSPAAAAPSSVSAVALAPHDRILAAITRSMARKEMASSPREVRGRVAQWMGTASLVVEDGGSEDEMLAALLVPGDGSAATPEDEIRSIEGQFGERVASLVRTSDEARAVLKPGGDARLWSLYLRHAAPAARRIVCALRLRSARALLAEFQRLDIGKRLGFRDANQATLQDYRSVVEACLEAEYSSHLVDELDGVVLEMELAAGPVSAERRQKRPLDRLTDELVQKVDLIEG